MEKKMENEMETVLITQPCSAKPPRSVGQILQLGSHFVPLNIRCLYVNFRQKEAHNFENKPLAQENLVQFRLETITYIPSGTWLLFY